METPTRTPVRPSKFSDEIAAQIVARIAEGEPLAQICRDEGMPDPSTVWRWQQSDEAFAQAIARAREDGFDRIAEGTLEIADDGRNDWMEKFDKDGQSAGWVINGEHVQRSKLRIETRLKLLAKWDPKRYGEKIQAEHSGPDGGAIPFETVVRKVVDPQGER